MKNEPENNPSTNFREKVNDGVLKLQNVFSTLNIYLMKLQNILISATHQLAHYGTMFPPIQWLLEGLSMITLVHDEENKLPPVAKGAYTAIGGIVVGTCIFLFYAALSGMLMPSMPFIAVSCAFVLALSYLHLAYIHHFNTESKDYNTMKSKLNGLLDANEKLKPFRYILFEFYIAQYSSIKKYDLKLDIEKIKSDKKLQNIDLDEVKTFFENNSADIETFRLASAKYSKTTSKILLSGIYICSAIIILSTIVTAFINPVFLASFAIALTAVLIIKRNEIGYSLKRMIHEFSLKLSSDETEIYNDLRQKTTENLASVITYSLLGAAFITMMVNPPLGIALLIGTVMIRFIYEGVMKIINQPKDEKAGYEPVPKIDKPENLKSDSPEPKVSKHIAKEPTKEGPQISKKSSG